MTSESILGAQALNQSGMAALNRADAAEAARLFAQAASIDAQAPILWVNLATAHRLLGDEAAELAALQHALRLDQRHFGARLRLAQWYERNGDRPNAAEQWRKVLAIAPAPEQCGAELQQLIAHGRQLVLAEHATMAEALDRGLADITADLSPLAHRRFGAAVDFALGRRRIFNNECAGMYYPFLPADEFFDRSHFPWLEEFERNTDKIRAEFAALAATDDPAFVPYVSQEEGTPENIWTPLDRSRDWSALYLFKYGVPDERICTACPTTAALIRSMPNAQLHGRAPNAFFSVLAPGKRIPPHTGVTNIRAIVHVPLIVPDGCAFRVGDEVRPWREGEAFAFDDTIEHEAWNNSDKPRAILILDVWNPHISVEEQFLIAKYFEVADACGRRPDQHDVAG